MVIMLHILIDRARPGESVKTEMNAWKGRQHERERSRKSRTQSDIRYLIGYSTPGNHRIE